LGTFVAEAALTACTAVAHAALYADIPVRTVFAVFTALRTDVSTFRTACTAGTDCTHAVLAELTLFAVIALAADAVETGHAGKAKLVRCTFGAFFAAVLASQRALRASFSAIADPVSTSNAQHAIGAVELVPRTIGTYSAVIADEIGTLRAFFAADIADIAGGIIASAAFVAAFTTFEAEFAVVAQTAVFHAITAGSAVVLAVAVSVCPVAAMVTVVTFPVVVPPTAAEFAFHAVFVCGRYGNCKNRQCKFEDISINIQQIGCIMRNLFVFMTMFFFNILGSVRTCM
jgi:hypothetical protein